MTIRTNLGTVVMSWPARGVGRLGRGNSASTNLPLFAHFVEDVSEPISRGWVGFVPLPELWDSSAVVRLACSKFRIIECIVTSI